MKMCPCKDLYADFLSATFYNSPNLEIICSPTTERTIKILCPYNEIWLSNNQEQTMDTCYKMTESPKHFTKWKVLDISHTMIPFVWNFQKRQIYRDIKQIRSCLGLRVRAETDYNTRVSSVWEGDGNALKLDWGESCTTLQIC